MWSRNFIPRRGWPLRSGAMRLQGPRPSRIATQFRSTRRPYSNHASDENVGPSSANQTRYQLVATAVVTLGLGAYIGSQLGPSATAAATTESKGGSARMEYASKQQMIKAAHEIARAIGGGEDGDDDSSVSFDEDVIEAHGKSDWSSANTSNRPVAIVYPKSTQDVSIIAEICSRYTVPMVPYGAGSSIEGNFSSPHSGICVDFTHMDKILAFHPDDMDVVVQPGVNWMDLNTHTTRDGEGLFLPLDPSPTASIGGMVSTNCSGTNAFRYGTMKDWVVNVTVVLPSGQIIKTRNRPRKSSAGYNLTSLFVGAEGTLGFVTEITLKLAVVPADYGVASASFPTITDATTAAVKLIRSGIQLAALEIMDDVQMGMLKKYGSETVKNAGLDDKSTLFLKFSGTPESIQEDVSRTKDITKICNAATFKSSGSKSEADAIWLARKEALWTMTSNKPEGYQLWSTDVAVPISRLAEIIALSQKDASHLGLFNSIIGHVGDGNFHQAVFFDPDRPEQKQQVADCVYKMVDRAVDMEGTVSGEHAIGIGKKECLVAELGEETIDLMRTLKRAVDPKWIMNPGKVFDDRTR